MVVDQQKLTHLTYKTGHCCAYLARYRSSHTFIKLKKVGKSFAILKVTYINEKEKAEKKLLWKSSIFKFKK